MPDFGNFSRPLVGDKTAEFTLWNIAGHPTLTVAPALSDNADYQNGLIKQQRRLAEFVQMSGDRVAALDVSRNGDRVLYGRHVVKGWSGIVDANGAEVPFSTDNAIALMKALPVEVFDLLRNFATSASSFMDDDEPTPEQDAAAIKNSEPVSSGSSDASETDGP